MSRVLENYTFVGKGPANRYDWPTLLNGQIHELTHGEDFTCKPESFRNGARNAATSRGKTIQTAIDGDKVILQAQDAVTTAEPVVS